MKNLELDTQFMQKNGETRNQRVFLIKYNYLRNNSTNSSNVIKDNFQIVKLLCTWLHMSSNITSANLFSGRNSHVNCYRMDEWNKTIEHALGGVIFSLSFMCTVEECLLAF